MEKHCITCKHLEVDEEQTKQLGKAVIFCNRLAEDSNNPIAHVLSCSVGSFLVLKPKKFGCVLHEEK